MSSENLHAPRENLTKQTLNQHQAIVSLGEEIEAVDWYRQRADDCSDPALRDILLHNMQEEIEHACMVLEWLRRNMPEWAEEMDTYLYTDAPITEIEEAESGSSEAAPVNATSGVPDEDRAARPAYRFTVGSLKKNGA
ncbi:MAG: ferritin [Rhodospirillales bacterium]|nr:ferritin [Rhodospirillales bacterium]